jgi:DNA polymerase-4
MRTILHSDLNNFYASAACLSRPELRDVPMAVCGDPEARHGIVLSKNELAKKMGVKTAEAIWQAEQKCPNLVLVAPDFPLYLHLAAEVRGIYAEFSDRVEPFGLDEAWLDLSHIGASGQTVADEIRARVKKALDLTVSVGASFNKVFAKLASDLKKPDATTVISPDDYRRKVWPLPVRSLLYVGPATENKLHRRNLFSIGDVARCRPEALRAFLGKHGEMLWMYANGLENAPVIAQGEEAMIKSVGNSATPARDLMGDADARELFTILSESVGERLMRHGLVGRTVSISVRDTSLHTISAQHRLPLPTSIPSEIGACAMALFRNLWDWKRPVRSVGVCVSGLEPDGQAEQLSLFSDDRRARRWALERAVMDVRERYGHNIVRRAMLMDSDFQDVDPRDEHAAFQRQHVVKGAGDVV